MLKNTNWSPISVNFFVNLYVTVKTGQTGLLTLDLLAKYIRKRNLLRMLWEELSLFSSSSISSWSGNDFWQTGLVRELWSCNDF
jgi:hypothetical protein